MRVPYNYLPYEFANNSNIFKKWKKLIKSTDFTLGKYVEEFEKNFASYLGLKYCVSTNNGTDALILSLKALNIKQNDEIITVCNTFYATVGAIINIGAKPVFVDCNSRFQIDHNKIEKAITKKTKAIIPVHWGGASPKMYEIMKIAKKHNLNVIEDACMGIGGKINNKRPGTFGLINAFSFHPLKSLNVMGDGGMIATNNKKIFDWALKYRNHGMIDRDHINIWGVNMRMQPLQSIVASEGLEKLNRVIKIRNNNSRLLDIELKKISKYVTTPERIKGYTETFALYMALFKNRDKLKEFLIKNKIEVKIHYPIPLHLQKAAKNLGYKKKSFPIAEYQSKKILTIPVHQFINRNHIIFMINKIKEFYSINEYR